MAWSISHGGSANSTLSGTQINNLEDKLRKNRRADMNAMKAVFDRQSGDPFDIQPQQAGRIGAALHQAADGLKMWDRGWAQMARQIGDSALLAAKLGEPWRWS